MLPLILLLLSFKSLHHQKLLAEHLRIGLSGIQITPGVSGIALGQVAKVVPEIGGRILNLGLGRNRHLRALELLSSLRSLRHRRHAGADTSRGHADLFIRDRIRAILTEELAGVIGQHVGIGQDGLISFVLIRQLLQQGDGLHQLLVGLDQRILKTAGIFVENTGGIRTEVI